MSAALEKTDWVQIGEKIGEFLENLDWDTILAKAGKVVADALVAAIGMYVGMASAAPVSYTHLDVYKRQNMACCCLTASSASFSTAATSSSTLSTNGTCDSSVFLLTLPQRLAMI